MYVCPIIHFENIYQTCSNIFQQNKDTKRRDIDFKLLQGFKDTFRNPKCQKLLLLFAIQRQQKIFQFG